MKKLYKTIAAMLLISSLFSGCGKQEVVKEETVETSQEVQQPVEEEKAENTENTEEEQSEKELDIQIPKEQELVADYTSVNGLVMEEGSHIAVVVKNTELGYWKAVQQGMEQAIQDLNEALGYETDGEKIYMTYEGPKADSNVDEQVNILDAVISENPDVVCVAAIDMNSCLAQLESAEENGIPVIVLDSGLKDEDLVYSNCSTDNYSAGKEAAKKLCELIGQEGQIAVMSHLKLSETSESRVNGFVDEITENYPGVEIVNISYEPAKEGDASVKDQMESVLTLYPDLKGYFCTNQVVSEIALEVMEQEKYQNSKIQIVGFDLGEKQIQAIRDGKEAGTVCQNPYGMGYTAIIAGVRAAIGMENDKFIDAGYQWLDQTTIDLEENVRYLYQ